MKTPEKTLEEVRFLLYLVLGLLLTLILVPSAKANYVSFESNIFRLDTTRPVGTGFAIKTLKGTYLMTNWHVCSSSATGYMKAYHESEPTVGHTIKIIKMDSRVDLCILDFYGPGLKLAEKQNMRQKVVTSGHPRGSYKQRISIGNLTEKSKVTLDFKPIAASGECPDGFKPEYELPNMTLKCKGTITVIDTTLSIEGGCSGSPVMDYENDSDVGKVVGVINSTRKANIGDKTMGAMIPLDDVKEFLKGY